MQAVCFLSGPVGLDEKKAMSYQQVQDQTSVRSFFTWLFGQFGPTFIGLPVLKKTLTSPLKV
jgi:hypothetical protein